MTEQLQPPSFADRKTSSDLAAMNSGTRFVRACLRQPVDRTPVWFLRQAGRYMPEYQAVRRHHSLLEICKQPKLAAEVTITAAERLGVSPKTLLAKIRSVGLEE